MSAMIAQLRIGRLAAVVFSGLLLLGLGGCDGSTGSTGPAGPPGPSGPPAFGASPTGLNVTIDSVTVEDGVPVVEFSVVDQDGYYFAGLPSANFTIAKLVGGTEGRTDNWQSYVNRVETLAPAAPRGPGALDTALQATSENNISGNTRGTLVNHENGRYTYTFGNSLTTVTYPGTTEQVVYEPTLTHRVGLQVTGQYRGQALPHTNATYTFVPATGATEGIDDRRIATTETCNECHGQLVVHGNPGRVDVAYCVTCHNPGTTDANSGENLDMAVMVHRIHRGRSLPSVAVGGMEYAIWGFGNSKHDYSTVGFPQDVRNCTSCHDAADERTPEASWVTTQSSIEACGSCHDNVVFDGSPTEAWQVAHPQQTENAECSTCHRPGGLGSSIAASHDIPGKALAQSLQYNILELDTDTVGAPQVRFSVTQDGTPVTLPGPFDGGAMTVRLNWAIAGVLDYQSNSGLTVNGLTGATANGDGTYTATFAATVPPDASVVAVGIEGHARDDGAPASVTNAIAFFNADGSEAVGRRHVVSMETCASCHSTNEFRAARHSGNRTFEQPQYCVMCHNGTRNNGSDMKFMIHAVHAGDFKLGPADGGLARHRPQMLYPNSPSDCRACHDGNTFQLPLAAGVPVSNIAGGVITPQAAACASCHDGPVARAHMVQNGSAIGVPLAEAADPVTRLPTVVETCAVCHGPGQMADVRTVHGLD